MAPRSLSVFCSIRSIQGWQATGILLARGPAILSRDALFYDGSVDDAAKIAAKHAELTALGIVIRDSA